MKSLSSVPSVTSLTLVGGALVATTVVAAVALSRHANGSVAPRGQASAQPASLIPADADPCAWVSSDDVAKLVGRLAGPPRRGHSASNTDPAPHGKACVYTLAAVAQGAEGGEEIAIEVNGEDAMANETSQEVGKELGARVLGVGDDSSTSSKGSGTSAGWDYAGWLPTAFTGRIGHVAVAISQHTQGKPLSSVPADSIERLAVLVRSRLPDVPMASANWRSSFAAGKRDPCSLLSRDEVERVVGKLAFAPYRSTSDTPLAEPTGEGCSFYLGRHRTLTIRPTWTQGKTLFGVAVGAS